MGDESPEDTVESLRATLDAKHERVMQLSNALPRLPERQLTDEEAEAYLSMNRQIIEELGEMEKIHQRIEELWTKAFSRNPSFLTTPFATAIRRVVNSRVDAQIKESLAEQQIAQKL